MSDLRLLVCVDRSPAALAAARLAVQLASTYGGRVRAVSVVEDSAIAHRLDARGRPGRLASERLEAGVRSVLEWIDTLGTRRHVPVETELLHGDPLRSILDDARAWKPEMVLIGRSDRTGAASPMLGSLATQVAEFTEWPLVIVPEVAEAGPPPRTGLDTPAASS